MLYKKIRFLPVPLTEKIKDCGVFGRSLASYGWLEQRPRIGTSKQVDIEMWKAIGRTGHINAFLRQVIGGAHTPMGITAFMRQLQTLAKRNEAFNLQGIQWRPCALDSFVSEKLEALNWIREGDLYRHSLYREGFRISDLSQDDTWKRVAHFIRESYRESQFDLYCASGRHEMAGQQIGQYSMERRQMAIQWAKKDSVALMLIAGGIQSPLYRARIRDIHSQCCICQAPDPCWDHLWQCFAKIAPPQDYLLRRLLWPRNERDLPLCDAFLSGMKQMGSC